MPKVPLSSITSGYGTVDALNANFNAIEAAFDNTLSRDGDTPNQMTANLDMNGFSILNQKNPITVEGFNWEGQWLTATAYQVGDVIQQSGSVYICVIAHTSGTFATDLAALRWQLVVQANFPTQTGNNGKYLTTNGTSVSWDDVKYTPLGTGAVQRPVTGKLQEFVSVKDFGAVGDGSVSDQAAFILARDNGKAFFVPSGNYDIPTAFDSQSTPVVSLGAQIDLGAPGSTYMRSFLDIGKKAIFRQSIRDTAEYTGTPTAYTYITDLTSIDIRHQNGAGYQQFFTNDSGGRTAVPAVYIDGSHFGYGDVPGVSVHYGVSRHPSWASIANTWTGANSVVCFDGDVQALTPNVNVYGAEYHLGDQGNDRVAANGLVLDFQRDNGNPSVGGTYNTVWTGVRLQTSGAYAADSGLSINGKWNVGIDFSGATLTNNAAMALKTNDRIYFGVPAVAPPLWHANVLSNTYMSLETGSLNFINAGVNAFKIESTLVTSTPEHKFINSCNFVSSGYISSTVGAAGGASALPAAPFTYLKIKIDGATYKIPVYNN
jgi:hypothetical protein